MLSVVSQTLISLVSLFGAFFSFKLWEVMLGNLNVKFGQWTLGVAGQKLYQITRETV